ncbi:MAG: bioflim formation protein [Thermaceae bacterium]
MRRLIALLGLLSLAWAQGPAYPENTLGLAYAPDGGRLFLQGSAPLPFTPRGIDTGLEAQLLLSTTPEAYALFKANLLPGLVLMDLYTSVGAGLDLRWPFGVHLGPLVSFELPGSALWLSLGAGYQEGLHLAYGAGLRVYLEPLALEVSATDRYPLALGLLYLW